MSVLLLSLGAMGAAIYAYTKLQDMSERRGNESSRSIIVERSREEDNGLSTWNDEWVIDPTSSGRIYITLETEVKSLIIALANSWRNPQQGGVAVVVNAPIMPTILPDVIRTPVIYVQRYSYLADLPYTTHPAYQSDGYILNERLKPGKYWLEYSNGRYYSFGIENRTLMSGEGVIGRYLALGVPGSSVDVSCRVELPCVNAASIEQVRLMK